MKNKSIALFIITFFISLLFTFSLIQTNEGKYFSIVQTVKAEAGGGNSIPCYKNLDCPGSTYYVVKCSSCTPFYCAGRSRRGHCTQLGTQ